MVIRPDTAYCKITLLNPPRCNSWNVSICLENNNYKSSIETMNYRFYVLINRISPYFLTLKCIIIKYINSIFSILKCEASDLKSDSNLACYIMQPRLKISQSVMDWVTAYIKKKIKMIRLSVNWDFYFLDS